MHVQDVASGLLLKCCLASHFSCHVAVVWKHLASVFGKQSVIVQVQELMEDPVITADGHTYNRAHIEQWFSIGQRTSPKTGLTLRHLELIPNYSIKSQIQDWQ